MRFSENQKMMLLRLLAIVVSLVIITSVTTSAHAAVWTKSDSPPPIRHTASNPGSIKICGDHKCAPFENLKKPLKSNLKQILQARTK